jgi:FkbM family methyltransferase
MIDDVLRRPEFEAQPPVLVDIGASGGLHAAWKTLAKYAICVAFDADAREMRQKSAAPVGYRRLHIVDRALTTDEEGIADFYLTKEPACSSLLPPCTEKLAAWEFAERFRVVQKSTVQTMRLQTALRELRIERVDWFKSDSQGTDLRLFQSLGPLMRWVLVAEFEPGILDSYLGEDKLWQLMASMDSLGFWMSDIEVMGSQRLRKGLMTGFRRIEREYLVHLLKPAPGWAEVTYLNTFTADDFSLRDCLLAWVCATVKRQHGFALELAATAKARFNDPICAKLEQHSKLAIRRCYLNLPAYLPLISRAFRRWTKRNRHANSSVSLPAGRHSAVGGEGRGSS